MSVPTDDNDPGSIAIVGIAGRFPSAATASDLWTLLRDGREAAQWLTNDELRAAGVGSEDLADPNYVRASLVLPDMEMFDAEFFGFSKRDAAVLDPQHRHFLECAWEALEDAGHMPENFEGAIGVFGGCGMQAYLPYNLLSNPELVKSMGMFLLRHTGNDKDFLCSRVSYLLDLKGPSLSIQTACSTSLVAVHVAAQSLLSGECDMALAGGVSIELPHRRGYRFAEGEIMSPDGRCRAFDDAAAGTIFGSGAAMVVLRRLDDALRDGDNIYAVIRGSAVNNDGSQKAGYFAPSVDGQARAAVEALGVAGIDPATVSYIEAHGTGTPVGDPIEVAALSQAYGTGGGRGFCGIGSIKTNIGHLDTAAGAAALIKVSLALRHGLIPASLNFSKPNPRLDIASTPFYVVDKARPWPRNAAPRRAGVNSLGVGGTNAHAIVEEAPLPGARVSDDGSQVFTLSARTPASLERLRAKWLAFLSEPPPGFGFADAAFTTQVGRRMFDHRCAIVASDVADLRAVLQARNHPRCRTGKAASTPPDVVLMFPGGGAHYPGAGSELLLQDAFRNAVDECFGALPADAPADLRALMFECQPGDAEAARRLEQPRYAIPALFTLEYALARLWESWGVQPAAVIGHSAGEYAAACIAGVMSLADALSIVVLRGWLFEQVPPGAMLSVDLAEAPLREAMAGLDLDIAAVNAPDLCIASGSLDAISRLGEELAGRGIEGRPLRINVAAHSRLLDGVLATFRDRVSRIRFSAPRIPFISNLTGTWVDERGLVDPEYWVRHLRNPVRFAEGLAHAFELPGAILIEAGPGQGLCALARHNSAGRPLTTLASTGKADEPNADLAVMKASAGALWTRGLVPRWAAIRGTGPHRRISLPTYAFERERHWIEPAVQPLAQAQVQAAAPRPVVIERIPSYDDWFRVPEWVRAPLAHRQVQAASHWLVFGDRSQLTLDVVAHAAGCGGGVTLVRHGERFERFADGSFAIAPADSAQHAELLRHLEQSGQVPDRIVHLWALDTLPAAGIRQVENQTLAFDSLVHLARAIQELDLAHLIRLTVVTAGSLAVADEAVPHPERALALGPCRVIPREIPNVSTRLVDLAASDVASEAVARDVVQEAGHGDEVDVAAYRGGERWKARLGRPQASGKPARERVREGGVYLITGGLGDIALDLATFLASTCKARLALVSRRALPPKANWRRMAASGDQSADARLVRRLVAIEEAGAHVVAFSADVADPRAMARVVGDCRARFGTINGVFHAAGALDDALIATKSADSIQRVLRPKAGGAQVLHELLPPGDLDVFAMFSSASVFLGAAGQVDYVAANAFLDSLAASRPDGLSVRWGIWGDKGMAARAYGRPDGGHEARNGTHPLLGVQVDGENGAAFEATYSSEDLWVLREHSVGGRPVLPGTACIEIVRAAMMVLHPQAAVEIRSLSFEEAMVFDAGAKRQVRVEMRRIGGGYDFLLRSRDVGDDRWLEHARATVNMFHGTLPAASPLPDRPWRPGEVPQESAVAFGPRWRNVVRMWIGERSAAAELELPHEFMSDLSDYAVHPAITDMAATVGLHLVNAEERRLNLFVPMSVECIRIAAPVPRRSVSRVALKGPPQSRLAAFDVSLHAQDGTPIATFEGFTLRGVKPEAVSNHAVPRRGATLTERMLAQGIRGEDSQELFARILSGARRDIVVSSIDLAELKRAMAELTPKTAVRKAPATRDATASSGLDLVETFIADAWRELLGVDEIAPDDDFFALGGHSLAAVRLFAKIRKRFNVDLPLATLFQAPTLAVLSALVAQTGGIDTAAAEVPPTEASRKAASNVIPLGARAWSPLVPICRGRPDQVPLFCVHGAGGNVLNFKVISDGLGPDQPFYGLQAQGVDGRLPALATIEEMAAQYVEAIRAVQPRGPYRLAGYSAGGVIALEMAQQLKSAGAVTDLLMLIDTLSPAASRRKVSTLRKFGLVRHWSLKFALEWPGRRRRNKLAEAACAQALERLARGEPLPPELVEFHLFRNFVNAQSRYVPAPYQGSVALFTATEADTQYLGAGDRLGWEEHVQGDVRVTRIPGSHFSMMTGPGVSELIKAFRQALGIGEEPERGRSDPADTAGALPTAGGIVGS
ncbi:polyketide synthase [Piscinibacter sp.]|uniref:type I polyketide synthase n=1 Tax=Piscinibacter sp. TaxID=1903157 RepID=UPI002D1C21C7|nr:polyketide synthase [Albitalea sp.]HUG25488.1 beta-ketoacyl synthase N-terminal-like domain-containing protein [Albitalea sp.]